jgi:hypothetical protein
MRSLLIFRPGGHFASPATEAGTWIARQNGFVNEPRLRFLRKTAAIAQKGDMIAIENPRLLGIECEFFAPGKQRLDTLKQCIVQEDFAAMTGKFWRDLAFDRLNLVIGVGARQMKKTERMRVRSRPLLSSASIVFLKGLARACWSGPSRLPQCFGAKAPIIHEPTCKGLAAWHKIRRGALLDLFRMGDGGRISYRYFLSVLGFPGGSDQIESGLHAGRREVNGRGGGARPAKHASRKNDAQSASRTTESGARAAPFRPDPRGTHYLSIPCLSLRSENTSRETPAPRASG